MKSALALAILGWNTILPSSAFAPINNSRVGAAHSDRRSANAPSLLFAEGFGNTSVKDRPNKNKSTASESSIENLSAEEAKKRLIDLIPRMTGKDEEYRTVEAYVNLLEDKYSPVQTIDFLNLAMSGEWQLVSICCELCVDSLCVHVLIHFYGQLFSTNLTGAPSRKLRLRELVQRIEADGFNGSLTNIAQWDLAEDGEVFDANGSFSVKCSYKINQGARMIVDLNDHELRPARGSKIPEDVPGLVGE